MTRLILASIFVLGFAQLAQAGTCDNELVQSAAKAQRQFSDVDCSSASISTGTASVSENSPGEIKIVLACKSSNGPYMEQFIANLDNANDCSNISAKFQMSWNPSVF